MMQNSLFLETISEESRIEIEISPITARKTEKDVWPFVVFQINLMNVNSTLLLVKPVI